MVDLLLHRQLDLNRRTRVHGFGEAAGVDAVVQQHGSFGRIHKQTCRTAQNKVTVGHAARENGALEAVCIHVGVELIAAELRKIFDVLQRDGVRCGRDGVSDAQVFKMLAKQVRIGLRTVRARVVALGHMAEHVGVALNGYALQVVQYAADSTHLFAVAGTSGSAVRQKGHGRTVARTFLGRRSVQHQHAPVAVARFEHKFFGRVLIGRHDGRNQRSAAHRGNLGRLGNVAVGHQSCHGAKGLDSVGRILLERTRTAHQHWLEPGSVGTAIYRAVDDFVLARKYLSRLAHALRLKRCGQWPHTDALLRGVADPNSVQTLSEGALNRLHLLLWNNYPPHCSTLLARLDGHFFGDFFDKKIKLGGSDHGLGAQHRCIQRVCLKVKGNAKFAEASRGLKAVARCVGSREGHHILALHSIQ